MVGRHFKSTVRKSAARIYYLSRLYRASHRGEVLILTYHRILSHDQLQKRYVQPGMYVLDHVFEQHLQFLQEHFQVLSFGELLERWKKKIWDRRQRYCLITFDDGWLDNYLYAYPLLKKHRLPATIFLPTDFVGTEEWFWPEKLCYFVEQSGNPNLDSSKRAAFWLYMEQFLDGGRNTAPASTADRTNDTEHTCDRIIERCKDLPVETIHELIGCLGGTLELKIPEERIVVDWDEVAQMSQNGVSFGSHSCSHRILTRLPWHEVKRELEESNQVLQKKRIKHVPVFCYPNGDCNQDVQNLARDCGYLAAVGVRRGFEGESPQNPFELSRIGVHNDIASTIPLFAFHILGPL